MEVTYIREPTEEELSKVSKWSATSKRILEIIKERRSVSTVELSHITGYKLSTINAQISILRRMGLIENSPLSIKKSSVMECFDPSVNGQLSIESVYKVIERAEKRSLEKVPSVPSQYEIKNTILKESGKISIDVLQGDCLTYLRKGTGEKVHLTFLDPPFNQGKEYNYFDDEQNPKLYWGWLKKILHYIFKFTVEGGSIYFMQREKNTDWMMKVLKEAGWTFQNLIVWKKLTSAVPCPIRYGKQHQVIIFATKGEKPRLFNKLRIDYPIKPWHKYERTNGIYVTDVWDDIRELTSGYFAGDEALRDENGKRLHEQQSPVALLLRIILSSSIPGDVVFDPFAGTGTTLVVAYQLMRNAIGIEIDPSYIDVMNKRLKSIRAADDILKYRNYYRFTSNLDEIWPVERLSKYL